MAAGKHTSVRVALAVPPKLHEQISAWAEYEGRPVASLCMYLIENALREAQKTGLAPSWSSEQDESYDGIEKWEPTAPQLQVIKERVNTHGTRGSHKLPPDMQELLDEEVSKGKYIKPESEFTKKELILAKLTDLLLT